MATATSTSSHYSSPGVSARNNDRIPMVIKSMIISYLSFRSYLSIMRLNLAWRTAAQPFQRKWPHCQAASFMIHSSTNVPILSSMTKSDIPLLLSDGYEWYNRLVPFAPKTLILPTTHLYPSQVQLLSLLHPTITSISCVDIPEWSPTDVGEGWYWQLTSLSLSKQQRGLKTGHHLFKCLPQLTHYHGYLGPLAISKLPLSLTSLHLSEVSITHIMDILAHLPSLTHIYSDGTDRHEQYNNHQRRRLLNHPTLTSLGGDIWNVTASNLLGSVGDGLTRLKCIDTGFLDDGFTNALSRVAPNLTQIAYHLYFQHEMELQTLGIMKSLTHLKLTIHCNSLLPSLVPNVSHVLRDLTITSPFHDDSIYELFRGLPQLTSLTFSVIDDVAINGPNVIMLDSSTAFAALGLPLLPCVNLTGQLNDVKLWQSLINILPHCPCARSSSSSSLPPRSDRRFYFENSNLATLWIQEKVIEPSSVRIMKEGIYLCDPISLQPILD
jgi:hypothetical protein